MIERLGRIVQEVNAAESLDLALKLIVKRVKAVMKTEVCSVYLLSEKDKKYILSATQGLNKKSVGVASLGMSEGLVGQVAMRQEPINIENAPEHPHYHFVKGTGEEAFKAFLGVPIIHKRKGLGVLVVQHTHARKFGEDEEAFLITITAQLASVLAHAEAVGEFNVVGKKSEIVQDRVYTGISASPGVAVGKVHVVTPRADLDSVPDKQADDIENEVIIFRKALESVKSSVKRMSKKLSPMLSPEEKTLFDAYLKILDYNSLGGEVEKVILGGQWAQGAVRQVIKKHLKNFKRMDDPYLRERGMDVKDLGRRVLACLQESEEVKTDFLENIILVGEELAAADIAEIPADKIAAIVSVQGSGNSHAAILARALGAPAIMGATDVPITQLSGSDAAVDGYNGQFFVNLSNDLKKHFVLLSEEEHELEQGLESIADERSITKDKKEVPLWVNTGLMADVAKALQRGAEGVGLFRTEIPFMVRERFPSEQEQYYVYREQLQAFYPLPVTMRTLDIGGDKSLPYFPIKENNPFLGWRGIRITLDHPEIFMVQLRAMLRASEGLDNLRILLPMISFVNEIEEANHLIHRAYCELKDEGVNLSMPGVGAMIEVPAAVYQIDQICERVDFVSVGSNDLVQYMLAVDRTNARVGELYNALHPSVLMALDHIVTRAHKLNKKVSICGEIAGDPVSAILLVAMGYDYLSMNATQLLRIKCLIRGLTTKEMKHILNDVMGMDDGDVIRSYVELKLTKAGLGGLIKPGK